MELLLRISSRQEKYLDKLNQIVKEILFSIQCKKKSAF